MAFASHDSRIIFEVPDCQYHAPSSLWPADDAAIQSLGSGSFRLPDGKCSHEVAETANFGGSARAAPGAKERILDRHPVKVRLIAEPSCTRKLEG